MITFIYGTYGSGKTFSVLNEIKKDTSEGRHTFLIVPDQEAVQSELTTLNYLPNSAQLNLEVLGFSRLYNRVCREYGGLSYKYITKPMKHLIMWSVMRELSGALYEFGKYSDRDFSICDVMLSTIGELKASSITPEMLEDALADLEPDSSLWRRISDISCIYKAYDEFILDGYSDSSDDISRLYDVLRTKHFFSGANVYIDSFTSFTAAEHRVIERIFADAENVTVTIPLPSPECNDISVKSIKCSEERLVHSARINGGYTRKILRGNRRALSPVLAHISENLWRLDLSSGYGKIINDGSISAEICDNVYAEAEFAANKILDLLRSGERCRDILVLMRSPENYRGIIEPALEKNGIPYYFSDRTDLNSLPPVKLLLSALRIKQYNWQKNDIITHIKTGIYSFPTRSCDLFEEYVNTWNLSGSKFRTDEPWSMNPDGYAESLSERGRDILSAANDIKIRLTSTLERFFIRLDASENIPDMCRAVYSYFTDIELDARLSELALAEEKRGNQKSARELLSVYEIILNSLADIAHLLPDKKASTDEFALILRAVFNNTDFGTIPTSVDEVVIGSAATLRAQNPKYTFVLGLCDGEFPAVINDSGIFSSADRSSLEELGIELSSDTDTRSSDELMFAQRAFASPSHGLFISTSSAEFGGRSRNPSIPFNRVLAMLEGYKPHRFSGNDIGYLAGAPRSAVSHLRTIEDDGSREALRMALSTHIPKIRSLSDDDLSQGDCSVSENTVKEIFGNKAGFSASKFERFVLCPMSFYGTYVLDLRKKVNSDFMSSDMGTFVHAILERMVAFATSPKEDGALPTDEEITEMTERAVLEYIERISPVELRKSKKLSHVYTRLKSLALLMVRNIADEFAKSDFSPAFFELSIDGRNGNPPPLEFVSEDGFTLSFSGKIDRVDLYRDDGRVYIRVVDYKTGTKDFSLDDVEHGINTQMLLYLFMLCSKADNDFCRSIGVSDGDKPVPAGVVYLSANIPIIQSAFPENAEEIAKKAQSELKRSGLLLNSPEILHAMSHDLSSKILAGIRVKKKTGELYGDALASSEKFDSLYSEITDTIQKISLELRKGKAGATPLRYGSSDPCSYCQMKPFCRIDKIQGGNDNG
ncbi:MAG: hypothetical protein E7607_03170 [Ruminococcaceae bacterium]|nr:hypothetical protein [Oscillospiraceae bacterium]